MFIKFNGSKSDDFGLRLLSGFNHTSAKHDVEEIEVIGRDGVLLKDNKRLMPVPVSYQFTAQDDNGIVDVLERINEWVNVKGWRELELEWDDKHYYLAYFDSTLSIKETFYQFGTLKLDFKLYPIKYLKSGRQPITVTNNMRLDNIGKVSSKPVVSVRGHGNITIGFNGKLLKLENVQDSIVIDSAKRLVYNETGQQWDKMLRANEDDFPVLQKGQNIITLSGVRSIDITPNWAVRV